MKWAKVDQDHCFLLNVSSRLCPPSHFLQSARITKLDSRSHDPVEILEETIYANSSLLNMRVLDMQLMALTVLVLWGLAFWIISGLRGLVKQ